MHTLESERLILRPVENEDLDCLLRLRNNKKICDSIIFEPISMLQQQKWFKNLKNSMPFIIELKEYGTIGTIGLYDINTTHQRAKWNLRIHPKHWRQGFANESIKIFLDYVFNKLNINKLMGDCLEENIAEVNNLKKLGFISEGIWKDHYYHNGKFKNAIQFVMFKSDYQYKRLHNEL